MEFIYILYNYIQGNLECFLFICIYIILSIYLLKRFIREKHYPFIYRFFDYIGSFLFFFSPALTVHIELICDVPSSMLVGFILFLWGIGILCIGVSLLLLPYKNVENSVALKKRKGKWKLCIACSFYVFLLAIGYILNG